MKTNVSYLQSYVEHVSGFSLKKFRPVLLIILSVLIGGCIKQFTPEISENPDILVVEGLITDQPGQKTIKISTSSSLGVKYSANPFRGCRVTISDDLGNFYTLTEQSAGNYVTDATFQASVGRSYALHIKTDPAHHDLSYQSDPVLMKPVPPIDSIYWERVIFSQLNPTWPTGEGCQIYLNTHDPDNLCRFYRWQFVETWEMRLPYYTPNNHCWITNRSDNIIIKSTSSLTEDKIERVPVNLVTNVSDRLAFRYSILVNQYSISEEEYTFWDKLKSIGIQVGTLFDIIPSSTPSNIWCIEKPEEKVLGYFSVSAVKSKRIFIKDSFRGLPRLYDDCANQVVGYYDSIPRLNIDRWIIETNQELNYKILTYHKGCADCTVRGTTTEPDYWEEGVK